MMTNRIHELHKAYVTELKKRIAANPDAYPWAQAATIIHGNGTQTTIPQKTPEQFAETFMHAVHAGKYTFSGNNTLKAACKQLGVKPTQKALNAWLKD